LRPSQAVAIGGTTIGAGGHAPMGANHGGAWGGFAPPRNFTGGADNGPSPPKKTGVSPPTFRNMRGLTRLIVTISPSTFFPATEIGNCRL